MRQILSLLTTGLFVATWMLGATPVEAAFPERLVRVIVVVAAGGSTDATCRIVAHKLSERWGQPVIIENRPGANGAIGREVVAAAQPNGYTLYCDSGSFTVEAAKSEDYDPLKHFAPISRVASQPRILVSNPKNTPFRDIQGMLAYAKANPTKLNIGHGGTGSDSFFASVYLMNETGIQLTPIGFSEGSSRSATALLGGEIELAWTTVAAAAPLVQSGQMLILGAGSLKRFPQLPDVPTIAEVSRRADFESETWVGYWAPLNTPADIVSKVHDDIAATMSTPDAVKQMGNLGLAIISSTPGEFADFVTHDVASNRAVLKTIKDKYDAK